MYRQAHILINNLTNMNTLRIQSTLLFGVAENRKILKSVRETCQNITLKICLCYIKRTRHHSQKCCKLKELCNLLRNAQFCFHLLTLIKSRQIFFVAFWTYVETISTLAEHIRKWFHRWLSISGNDFIACWANRETLFFYKQRVTLQDRGREPLLYPASQSELRVMHLWAYRRSSPHSSHYSWATLYSTCR